MTALLELDVADPRWLALVADSPEATVFHHPAWCRVLADAYGYPSTVLAADDGGGGLAAGAPVARVRRLRRPALVSLPFSDHCPALARDPAGRARLAAGLAAWASRAGAPIEVRGGIPAGGAWQSVAIGVRHELPLDGGLDSLPARFHPTHRKRLRQAQRGPLSVRIGTSADDVDNFYRLHLANRRRQGVPVQPRRFFDALRRHVIAPGLGVVALAAEPGGRPVAGAVVLAWNGTATTKFTASDAGALRLRPNHLVYWAVFEWAVAAGCRRIDFGRTETSHESLRQWKESWGAEPSPLAYARTDAAPTAGEGRLAGAIAPVIRHSPAFVCRALGALLYRYAA